MISVIDGVNVRVLRIMLLKNGKEVSSLSWINVLSFIHKILIFYSTVSVMFISLTLTNVDFRMSRDFFPWILRGISVDFA